MGAFSVHTLIVLLLGFYGVHMCAGSLIREFDHLSEGLAISKTTINASNTSNTSDAKIPRLLDQLGSEVQNTASWVG